MPRQRLYTINGWTEYDLKIDYTADEVKHGWAQLPRLFSKIRTFDNHVIPHGKVGTVIATRFITLGMGKQTYHVFVQLNPVKPEL